MAGAAAFDQLKCRVNFIGPVDGQINALYCVERLQRNAQLGGEHLALKGGGHSCDVLEATILQTSPELLNHQRGGGA